MKLTITDGLRIVCAIFLGSVLSFVGAFIAGGAFASIYRIFDARKEPVFPPRGEPVFLMVFVAIVIGWIIGSGIAAGCIQGMSRRLFLWIATLIAVVLIFPILSFFVIGCGMDGGSCASSRVGSIFILFPGLPLAAFIAVGWVRMLWHVMNMRGAGDRVVG